MRRILKLGIDRYRLASAAAGIALVSLGACSPTNNPAAVGDPRQGVLLIGRMACGSCHVIPGGEEAVGQVGPSLKHFATRSIIAGHLPNSTPNLIRYLQNPDIASPGNVMPNEGLTERQASDIAAYLYTLR